MQEIREIAERWGLAGAVIVAAVAAVFADKFGALPLWGWGALFFASVLVGVVGSRNDVADAVGGLQATVSTSFDELGDVVEKTARDVADVRSIVHQNLSHELLIWHLPAFGARLKWVLAQAVLTVRSGAGVESHVSDVFLPVLHAAARELAGRTRYLDEGEIRLAYTDALHAILPDLPALVAQPGAGGYHLHQLIDRSVDRATGNLVAALGGGR